MKALLFLAAVGPLLAQCTYQVSPTGTSIDAERAEGTINVTTQNNCAWTYSANVAWLSFTFGQGQRSGSGSLGWAAQRNPTGSARTGVISVAGQNVTITQAGQNCSYTPIGQTSRSHAVAGGSGTFEINTTCQWQAVPSASWIKTTSTGETRGVVNYTVDPNACVADRSGFITVGTQQFAIAQSGSTSNLTVTPTTANVAIDGGSGNLAISTGAGCAWTALPTATWITLAAQGGTGPMSLAWTAAANSGPARTGLVRVGPATFTLNQAGTAAPASRITAVVSAASYALPPVAPGEIVVVYGEQIGPGAIVEYQLTADGRGISTSLAGTRVLFDNTPAPILYTSSGQVSAIVPYSVDGALSTQVILEYNGVRTPAFPVAVAASHPAIFTLDRSGRNAGAILNQDYSVNGEGNAAERGSVVQIFCTGGGTTLPASVDGRFTVAPFPNLTQPVTVTIGGADAKVWYAGGAPEAVAGLVQINAEVPAGIAAGAAVPVKIKIGDRETQDGVTLSVR